MLSHLRLFNAIAVSVLVVGTLLVSLALATVKAIDKLIIEEAAARNRHAEFLSIVGPVSRAITRTADIRNTTLMAGVVRDILELRPGIRWIEILDLSSQEEATILNSGRESGIGRFSENERNEIRAGRSTAIFDDSTKDRAWVISAPITLNNTVIGALRGRFSISKYDELILKQQDIAKDVAMGAVVVTSLAFLALVRIEIHRPIARLLETMERVSSGELDLEAPVTGPVEIRRLSSTFNRMMWQIHEGILEKERLLTEIQRLNATLEERIAGSLSALEQANRNLVIAQIEAERNEKLAAVGEMSAIVAHELGNPLNAISGRLQLIDTAGDPLDLDRHLRVVKGEIERMTTVIRNILDSTSFDTKTSPVNINQVIKEVLALLGFSAIKLETNLTEALPDIAVNRTSIHGVILNLFTNAVQAMPEGGELRITTQLCRGEAVRGKVILQGVSLVEHMVRITIQDSGIGIASHLIDRIFEPFFTTRHKQGGTGLGLAICRRVIASSGGRLAVESTVGAGTIFTLELPLYQHET